MIKISKPVQCGGDPDNRAERWRDAMPRRAFDSRRTLQGLLACVVLAFLAPCAIPQPVKRLTEQEIVTRFGNEQVWAQRYAARLKLAPAPVRRRLRDMQADIVKRGKRYTVGYTSVLAGEVTFPKITLTGLPTPKKPPKHHNPPPPRPAPPVPGPGQPSCSQSPADASASAVDMTAFGIVTSPRNQGVCGSCWSFGVTAALESAVLLGNGDSPGIDSTTLDLSEEQVLSCTDQHDLLFGIRLSIDTCGGGLASSAANYTTRHALVSESSWPYVGTQQASNCSPQEEKADTTRPRFKASSWDWVCNPTNLCFTPSNAAIKQAIVQHGSVATAFNIGGDCTGATPPTFCAYNGGVFDENNNQNYAGWPVTDHVMQIVGWNDNKGAWRVKNSWGTNWGEGGFVWIAYNTSNIGAFAVWVDAEIYNKACVAGSLGTACKGNAECTSGYCDAGDGTSKTNLCMPHHDGQPGDICSNDNQCGSLKCSGLAQDGHGGWTPGSCSATKGVGASCVAHAECASAFCNNGACAVKSSLGGGCSSNAQCTTSYCDAGNGTSHTGLCMPNHDGRDGDICSNDNQCDSQNCGGLAQDGHGGWTPGHCASKKTLGIACSANSQCNSGYCDAGNGTSHTGLCMPNHNGQNGDACSNNNQCTSQNCLGLTSSGGSWIPGKCASAGGLGVGCSANNQCASGYCDAGDGTSKTNLCMPNGNGHAGDICSHNNQCTSHNCNGLHASGNQWVPGACL